MKMAKKYELVIINIERKSVRDYGLECKLKKDQY